MVPRLLPLVALLCTNGVSACASQGDPFVPEYETPSLRVALTFDTELCLGHLDMWQAHVEFIERTFHVSREFAWMLVYEDPAPIAEDCGVDNPSRGCWNGEVAYVTTDSAQHELVHAWMASLHHKTLRSLSEGLAERLSGSVRARGDDLLTVADLLATVDIGDSLGYPAEKYEEAAHFVAWLLAEYTPDVFMEFYKQARVGMTEDELSAVTTEVFGITAEELLQNYQASAKDYYPGMSAAACGQGPVVPWKGEEATWSAAGSCAEGPLFGFAELGQWQRVTIEVQTAGTYRLDVGGRWAAMTRCILEPLDEAELPELKPDGIGGDWLFDTAMGDTLNQYPEWDHPLELDAAIYEVWVERSQDGAQSSAGMSLRRTEQNKSSQSSVEMDLRW